MSEIARARATLVRANDKFVAEIQQIAADVGVTLSKREVADLQMRAGEEKRPFKKVFREELEQRLTDGRIVTDN